MRSRTGASMTMGTEGADVQSIKQNFNSKGSTSVKLIIMDDVLIHAICTQYLLKYQEYAIRYNVIYKDNQRAIKLEHNVRQSSIRKTRLINISYNFFTDSIMNQGAYV